MRWYGNSSTRKFLIPLMVIVRHNNPQIGSRL